MFSKQAEALKASNNIFHSDPVWVAVWAGAKGRGKKSILLQGLDGNLRIFQSN